jgi:hypothetical protein
LNIKDLKSAISQFNDDQQVLIMCYTETGSLIYFDRILIEQQGHFIIIGEDVSIPNVPGEV